MRKRYAIFLFIHRFFLFSSLGYLGAALFSFIVFGPLETELFGHKVSFTSLANPLRISLGLYLLGFLSKALGTHQEESKLKNLWKNLWPGIKKDGTGADGPDSRSRQRYWIEVFCLGIVFCGLCFFLRHYTADVAGFADTYGYVSQAVRLSQGHFYEAEQVYSRFGLPEEAERSHPLGYKEKGSQGTVPAYPFGYPLIMAVFITFFGLQGAFWVTPAMAAGTILLTYWLGRVCLGWLGGILAASFLLFLPNFLHSSFFPMSDVPATFFSALALVSLLAFRPSRLADLFLGTSLGFGIWVRPNLILLILPVAFWLMAHKEWGRIFRLGLVIFPFILISGLLNKYLYDSFLTTGYGNPPIGDTLSNIVDRGGRHLMRLHDQQAGIGLFLVILGFLFGKVSTAMRLFLGGIFFVFWIFFSAYRWDDTWWYFRFLLPAMPAIAVLEASWLMQFLPIDKGKGWGKALLLGCFSVFAWASINLAHDYSVFNYRNLETKYTKAADMVVQNIKQPALILAMLYSGPIRFYTNLPTARYDLRSGPGMVERIRAVKKGGGNVYLLFDNWEFEKMIRPNSTNLLIDARLIARLMEPEKVWLFELNVPDPQPPLPGAGKGTRGT